MNCRELEAAIEAAKIAGRPIKYPLKDGSQVSIDLQNCPDGCCRIVIIPGPKRWRKLLRLGLRILRKGGRR